MSFLQASGLTPRPERAWEVAVVVVERSVAEPESPVASTVLALGPEAGVVVAAAAGAVGAWDGPPVAPAAHSQDVRTTRSGESPAPMARSPQVLPRHRAGAAGASPRATSSRRSPLRLVRPLRSSHADDRGAARGGAAARCLRGVIFRAQASPAGVDRRMAPLAAGAAAPDAAGSERVLSLAVGRRNRRTGSPAPRCVRTSNRFGCQTWTGRC